ncbi:N-acylneuraminate-9-phosphatase [Manis javanica]|nr:N-acylneuraminate-9-phosphatase [Manis javanica]
MTRLLPATAAFAMLEPCPKPPSPPRRIPLAPALAALQQLRRSGRIRAISIDLDDTLWPVWPAISRAEQVLLEWLHAHAPTTAAALRDVATLRAIRVQIERDRPDLAHDLSGLRRESIRLALQRNGDDGALAEPAFDLFAERQRGPVRGRAARPAVPGRALARGGAEQRQRQRARGGHWRAFPCRAERDQGRHGQARCALFHAAAAAGGVAPDEVLHIGDDARLDALGAMDAGMHAVWLNRTGVAWPHEGSTPHVTVASLAQLCQGLADS